MSIFQDSHTHCSNKTSIHLKTLYRQLWKQQALTFFPGFSSHRKFIHHKVRQEPAFTQILNNTSETKQSIKVEPEICWKMLLLYWQAWCWTQLFSILSNTFQLLHEISPCAVKWQGAQWRNANHLQFSGKNKTGLKSSVIAWFDFLIILFLLQWREMLWIVMRTEFGAMPPSRSWASLGCEGRKAGQCCRQNLDPPPIYCIWMF